MNEPSEEPSNNPEENSIKSPSLSPDLEEDEDRSLEKSLENSLNKSNDLPLDENLTNAVNPAPIKEKGCELFIGNLNINTKDHELFNLFRPFGEISDVRIHRNNETKKCYAFLRFEKKEMALGALTLNGTILNGRNIKITKSNENATIFIGNIRKSWSQQDVETKVKRVFQNLQKVEYFKDPSNPAKNRGFCFAVFNNRSEALKALNYVSKKGGINLDGISVTCDWADVVEDDNSSSCQIFLTNVKDVVNEDSLETFFKRFGKVISVVMTKNHIKSKRKDLAFITFESHDIALKAIAYSNSIKELEKNKEKASDPKLIEFRGLFKLCANETLENITISLAFSQEARMNKKKIKDSRLKLTQQKNLGNMNNNQTLSQNINQTLNQVGNINDNNNLNQNLLEAVSKSPAQFDMVLKNTLSSINPTDLVTALSILSLCQQNPAIVQQMTKQISQLNQKNTDNNLNNEKKFLKNKRLNNKNINETLYQNFNPQFNNQNMPSNIQNINSNLFPK